MLDLDKDGFITKEEFIQVEHNTKLWFKTLKILKLQASKTLDKQQIEKVFERFDVNKDGRLSKEEFQQLMEKHSR